MARMALLKEASKEVGLSEWELRNGSIAGKYPHLRVGNPKTGKLLFDLDLLEAHIKKLMEKSITQSEEKHLEIGKLRRIN